MRLYKISSGFHIVIVDIELTTFGLKRAKMAIYESHYPMKIY